MADYQTIQTPKNGYEAYRIILIETLKQLLCDTEIRNYAQVICDADHIYVMGERHLTRHTHTVAIRP